MILEQGLRYKLKYSSQFCHIATLSKESRSRINEKLHNGDLPVIFIGTIKTERDLYRNIFYHHNNGSSSYIMFTTKVIDYVVDEGRKKMLERVEMLQQELDFLKRQL